MAMDVINHPKKKITVSITCKSFVLDVMDEKMDLGGGMTSTHEQFQKDLAIGAKAETIFAECLGQRGYETTFSNGAKEYDIEAAGIKYEVKSDSYSQHNGNIAVRSEER